MFLLTECNCFRKHYGGFILIIIYELVDELRLLPVRRRHLGSIILESRAICIVVMGSVT